MTRLGKSKAKSKPKKRPVGPEAGLNFGVSQGLKAQRLLEAAKDHEVVSEAVADHREGLFAARTWSSHLSEMNFIPASVVFLEFLLFR